MSSKYDLKVLMKRKVWTEREISWVKKQLNDGKLSGLWFEDDEGKLLTPSHTKKGLEFLRNDRYTKYGKVRESTLLQEREGYVIDNFHHFVLRGYYNASRYTRSGERDRAFFPLYDVVADDGDTFQYYVNKKGINLTG